MSRLQHDIPREKSPLGITAGLMVDTRALLDAARKEAQP